MQLKSLNRERAELVAEQWVKCGKVPSAEEVGGHRWRVPRGEGVRAPDGARALWLPGTGCMWCPRGVSPRARTPRMHAAPHTWPQLRPPPPSTRPRALPPVAMPRTATPAAPPHCPSPHPALLPGPSFTSPLVI